MWRVKKKCGDFVVVSREFDGEVCPKVERRFGFLKKQMSPEKQATCCRGKVFKVLKAVDGIPKVVEAVSKKDVEELLWPIKNASLSSEEDVVKALMKVASYVEIVPENIINNPELHIRFYSEDKHLLANRLLGPRSVNVLFYINGKNEDIVLVEENTFGEVTVPMEEVVNHLFQIGLLKPVLRYVDGKIVTKITFDYTEKPFDVNGIVEMINAYGKLAEEIILGCKENAKTAKDAAKCALEKIRTQNKKHKAFILFKAHELYGDFKEYERALECIRKYVSEKVFNDVVLEIMKKIEKKYRID